VVEQPIRNRLPVIENIRLVNVFNGLASQHCSSFCVIVGRSTQNQRKKIWRDHAFAALVPKGDGSWRQTLWQSPNDRGVKWGSRSALGEEVVPVHASVRSRSTNCRLLI
jgi:hypothetical protein